MVCVSVIFTYNFVARYLHIRMRLFFLIIFKMVKKLVMFIYYNFNLNTIINIHHNISFLPILCSYRQRRIIINTLINITVLKIEFFFLSKPKFYSYFQNFSPLLLSLFFHLHQCYFTFDTVFKIFLFYVS